MRKKIARKLRKDALRRGAVLLDEKPCMSLKELRANGLTKSDAGFGLIVDYKGERIHCAFNSELECYRILLDVLDVIDEDAKDGKAR